MDLTGLSKDSKVAPMLVRLYDSHKLYSLAKDKKPLARTELSGAICELLDATYTSREGELIADVLISLIRQAETDLKEALSERLSGMQNVPLRVALHLANEEIDVARPMLVKSMVLGDLDLIYIIKSKGQEYWRAIARRESMSDQLINILTETKDNVTVHRLLENNTIVLPEEALKIMTGMAQESETIASPLLRRPEVDDKLASTLYKAVGEGLKHYIREHYIVDVDELLEAVDEAVVEFEEVVQSQYHPTQAMISEAKKHKENGALNIESMIATLRRMQVQSFIAQFSVYTGLPAEQIEEALNEDDGKNFALICKAFDILKQDCVTIYLLTNRMRKGGQMVDMGDVSKMISYYNRADSKKVREAYGLKED